MAEVTDIREDKATQLPEPTGYRILVGLPEIEEKTDGGILKAKETIQRRTQLQILQKTSSST